MRIKVYVHKRNPHKYIEVKRYCTDRHYYWRQYLKWDATCVINYTGDGRFHRQSASTVKEVLADYTRVYP